MNGATEATLADLLATAQAMNVNLIKLQQLAKSAGPGTGGGATASAASSVAGVVSSLNPLSMAFNVVKGAASAVGAVFGVMGSILGKVVGVATGLVKSLYDLGVATAISGTKLSDFYAAFQNIPLLGIGFGILADVLRYQEQLLDFFQQIAMSGASFSGSLDQMKFAATRSYMNMQDFATVVKENSEIFGQMGGTVMTSINKFVDIQNKLLGPKSEYANTLYGMGYTAKTTGDLLAYYMKIQATVNKEEQQSTEEIIKGTAEYAKELNLLSQLTGTNAKELQKQADAVAREDAYRMYKTTIGGEKAAREMQVITTLTKTAGKEIAEMYRDSYAGVLARTEDQRRAGVMIGKPLYDFLANIRRMTDAGASQAQLTEYSRQESVKMGMIVNQTSRAFQGIGPAMSSMYKPVVQIAEFAQSQKDLPTLAKNEMSARKNIAEAAKGNAAALERAEQGIRNFGEQMLMLAYQVIGPFIPYLQKFATFTVDLVKQFGSLATELTKKDGFKDAIKGIANWFSETFSSLKKSSDPKDFFNRLGTQLNVAYDAIKPALISMFNKFIEFFKPYALEMVNVVEDYVNAILFKKLGYASGAEDPEMRKKQREAEKLNLEAQRLTSEAERLSKEGARKELIDAAVAAAIAKNREAAEANEVYKAANAARSPRPVRGVGGDGTFMRHKGTIGMTGNWWEKSDATLDVQEGESVVTKEQMAQIVGAAGQNSLVESIQQLNNMMALQVKYTREAVEYARRNVDATKNLDGNLFARA